MMKNYHSTKYNAKKITADGIIFDSKKEYERYKKLKMNERLGTISDLQVHVKFELIPSQRIDGKVVERACTYEADFVYKADGKTVVEDVKGCKKGLAYQVFTIKRKLMLYKYGIRVKET